MPFLMTGSAARLHYLENLTAPMKHSRALSVADQKDEQQYRYYNQQIMFLSHFTKQVK